MDENVVPYIAHESAMSRMERVVTRVWILCIVLIVLLVGSNIAWILHENSSEKSVTTVTQNVKAEEGGVAIINDGIHITGESKK